MAAFVFSILGAFFFWKYKLIVAFVSVTMLLTLGVIDVSTLIESSEFDIILFLIAMTLIIAPLKRVGFFRWLTLFLLKISNFNIKALVMLFMVTSMIFAGIMGAVSSIVVITAMVMEFSDYFELDSKLFIILSILASNIGSSATALGNPVGLILALGADLSFEEFLRWSAPLAFLSIAIVILYVMKVHGSFL
ncbi:MAG: SLC13 family permease, partial [archaeon GB-1845-036]|nr:SLC13 family permease [Candidatus Culexmicrobium thermophilum]